MRSALKVADEGDAELHKTATAHARRAFKKAKNQRFGCLRMWPKWKSLRKIWAEEYVRSPGKTEEEARSSFEEVLARVGGGCGARSEENGKAGGAEKGCTPLDEACSE